MASKAEPHPTDPALRGVTHVFLDVDGTILASSPSIPDIFRQALERHGRLVSREAITQTLRSPETLFTIIRPLPKAREQDLFRSLNSRVLEHLHVETDEDVLDDIHHAFEKEVTWRPYAETIPVLKELHAAGLRLGVISNNTHRLPELLRKTGIAAYLDTVTYSFEVGAEKPQAKIFRSAIARAGTSPECALHVGDSYEADYLGARQAGLHAALLCRTGNPPRPCPAIRSLGDLPGLLGRNRSRD